VEIGLIILAFVACLLITIFVHEMGHFITAKRAGVKVEEFGLGFPPRLFGLQRGETLYSLNAIPAGAFVKAAGEDDPGVPRGLAGKGPWIRLWIYAAGPLANILLAVIFLSAYFMMPVQVVTGDGIMVHSVIADSPAAEVGIEPGDIILEIDGQPVREMRDIQAAPNYEQGGEEVTILLQRDDFQKAFILEPSFDDTLQRWTIGVLLCWNMVGDVGGGSPADQAGIEPGDVILEVEGEPVYGEESLYSILGSVERGEEIDLSLYREVGSLQVSIDSALIDGGSQIEPEMMGFSMLWVDGIQIEQRRLPVWRAVYLGAGYVASLPALVIESIPLIKAEPDRALVGPVGAGQLTVEAVEVMGWDYLLYLAGLISLGIGLFNFLPVPPLDGGGMVVAFIQGIRKGRRLSPRAMKLTYAIGTALIVSLAVAITFNDIMRLITGGKFIL